jgi:4-diphosphocytidyl-2-C-methyl-D-erythritol kinase
MLERRAPAKINLGLHVLRKRPDGYHDIETVMHCIGWADRVTATPADTLSMTCSDPQLPIDEGNLCMEAAQRLRALFDVAEGATLHLDKKVPYGAGLGSGSSDAVATLQLLNTLWGLDAPLDALHDIAASIGSDVPFFLDGAAALATGRGDQLAPLHGQHSTPYEMPFSVVVVVPDVRIATPDAYGMVTPSGEPRPDLPTLVRSSDLDRWRRELVNDFEAPVLEAYPTVRSAKQLLDDQGAEYASLSGSGSAVYGLFRDASVAREAARAARALGHRVHVDP